MTNECLFSGLPANTNEHVISDWLQRRFGLHRASYQLPSASGLAYCHAKVPAESTFNQRFGDIETRISQNKFVWEEVYLWLFKIHIGLMYRDTLLNSDRRNPASQPVVSPHIIQKQLEIFRALVSCYLNERHLFCATFSPPGSVFILPSMAPGTFDLQHSFTTGCIGVNIGDYYLAASLWDFQLAMNDGHFEWLWNPQHYRSPPAGLSTDETAAWWNHVQSIWLCNLGYWCFRWNINMYSATERDQPIEPAFEASPLQRAENSKELAKICRTFGLELVEFHAGGKSIFQMLPTRFGDGSTSQRKP